MSSIRRVNASLRRKVRLYDRRNELSGLMRGYGIDPKDTLCWFHLCIVLYDKLNEKTAAPRKKGAPVKWDDKTKGELVRAVDRILLKPPAKTAKTAIRILKQRDRPGRWKEYPANQLEARYSEFKPRYDIERVAKRAAREVDNPRQRVQKKLRSLEAPDTEKLR